MPFNGNSLRKIIGKVLIVERKFYEESEKKVKKFFY